MPYRRYRSSRRWIRPAAIVAVVVAVVLAVTAFAYLLGRHASQTAADGDGPAIFHHDNPSARAHRHQHPRRHHRSTGHGSSTGVDASAPDWIVGIPLGGGTLHPGVDVVPGALHHAVLSVSSSSGAPFGVKYAFRTASGFRTGRTATSRSWTADATVRGSEPLSGLVAQVGSGSITCTASIDGRVVDRKTNTGRFATVSCFG